MKLKLLSSFFLSLIVCYSFSQVQKKWSNPSYRYYSRPGFVNITEVHGAIGLGDISVDESKFYAGISNVFGYQINRYFIQGIGIGCFYYDTGVLIPVYFDMRHYRYLKKSTPFIFADGGVLLDPKAINQGTKLFINPGLGISRSFSSVIEGSLSAGLMVQMGNNLYRSSFGNVKLGIVLRKNYYKTREKIRKMHCDP